MRTIVQALWAAGISIIMACVTLQAHAQDAAPTAEELAAEIQAIKQEYEARIQALEGQLEAMTTAPARTAQPAASPMGHKTSTTDNAFNPAIGLVLDARYSTHSADHDFNPAGFQVGHGSERPLEGLALGHPELTLSGNVDDKFFGAATIAMDAHPGESVELEMEELYVQTLPGAGLPDGARIKAGRALWTFGYLNEIHLHADDFSDRPLPYRAFLHEAFNDDGLELSYVLPTDIYAEVGGGLYRGGDFPFGNSESGTSTLSGYGRIGGDFGRNGAWRIGAYMMAGEAHHRSSGAHAHGPEEADDEHGHGGEAEHHDEDEHEGEDDHAEDEHEGEDEHADDHADDHDEDEHGDEEGPFEWANIDAFVDGEFSGDVTMYAIDARLTWAPTGNPREQELILQGEVMWRVEDGMYSLPGEYYTPTFSDSTSMGFYVQGIYKLNRNFRVGARYARLSPPDIPACVLHGDHCEHDLVTPDLDDSVAYAVMADWTNSEFSRIRLQYNREEVHKFVHGPDPDAVLFVEQDDQILLQYIMSLGAHAAHTF